MTFLGTIARRAALTGAIVGAGSVAREALGRRSEADLAGQVVLITGASRGLGLALAREFAAHGCLLAICARSDDELDRAAEDLRGRGADVLAVPCDVGDATEVARMVAAATDRFGRIDILVNNAGTIIVGPIASTTPEDFQAALDVMLFGIVHPTFAVLPQMRERRAGRIVNVTSFEGKVPVPHMLPYAAAKFAAVGLSEGLHAELAGDGIDVTTVCPGPLRTGSFRNAYFSGDEETRVREYAWFSGGGASPLAVSAEKAARLIVRATKRGQAELIFPLSVNLLARAHGAAPSLSSHVLTAVNRFLPRAEDGQDSTETRRGADVEPAIAGSRLWRAVTALGRADAARLNQDPGTRQPFDDAPREPASGG